MFATYCILIIILVKVDTAPSLACEQLFQVIFLSDRRREDRVCSWDYICTYGDIILEKTGDVTVK
jgi:hypothetical protein